MYLLKAWNNTLMLLDDPGWNTDLGAALEIDPHPMTRGQGETAPRTLIRYRVTSG